MSENASAELLAAAKDAAARGLDYYALLGIDPSDDAITRETVQRAWRKRSLNYHPDKAKGNFDKEKWEEFGLARDILASQEARAAYDGARAAAMQRAREKDAMNARQRRFVEELEEAEGRSKRQREEWAARREEWAARREGEERERERLAAEGRRIVEERQRLVREAEERERQRKAKEDEAMDDRIRELQDKLAERTRRREEKRARKEARKGGAVAAVDEEGTKTESAPESRHSAEEWKRTAEGRTAPIPRREAPRSDDPVKFWETQWPKTRARLKAAQLVKEQRMKGAGTAA